MTLSEIKKLKNERGFTIVELLIVIVVIAILAAIVIVAYNGVTNNAKDSNDRSNATQIAKVAETIQADKGFYPGGTNDPTSVTTTATLKTSFAQGTTSKLPGGIDITYQASGAAPVYSPSGVLAAADETTRRYIVEVCGGTNGITVYYPRRSDSTVQSVSAGPGCA